MISVGLKGARANVDLPAPVVPTRTTSDSSGRLILTGLPEMGSASRPPPREPLAAGSGPPRSSAPARLPLRDLPRPDVGRWAGAGGPDASHDRLPRQHGIHRALDSAH